MAFPETVLPLAVELYLDGAWVSVPSHVYRRDMVNISRGRGDWASSVDASTLTLTLNNRSGDYSPRNPTGTYYGHLGRNTPIRVAIEDGTTYLDVPGAAADYASAPDSAALSITGDLDVRIDVVLYDWDGLTQDLIGKWESTGDEGSWALYLIADVGLRLYWTTDGVTLIDGTSTEVPPVPVSGRQALRATLDVNDGSGNHEVRFYTAPTLDGSWTQLGDTIVTAGTTSVFDSTSPLFIGKVPSFSFLGMQGRVLAAEVRNGIDGTVVANPDFTAQTAGDTSFADTAASANTWTINGSAEISNRRYRFHGEVSSWPPRWDITGTDVYVPITASGVLRRLSQSGSVLGSAMYRGRIYDTAGLVAYWPMEDEEGSTSLAPALSHEPLTITGSPTLGSFEDFTASNPILVLNGAELRGACPAHTDTGFAQVRCLLAVPAAGDGDNQAVITFYTTGTARRWELHYGTGGTLGLRSYDAGGTLLFDTGDFAFAADGELLLVSVELTQNGADIDYAVATLEPGASSGLSTTGTLSGNTFGRVGVVIVSPSGGLTGTAVGHLSVQNVVSDLFDLGSQLDAWRGETAGRRIERLCTEEGVSFRSIGDLDQTVRMGPQLPNTLLALLTEAADADLGMLFEPRDVLGLGYRTRESLYNQAAHLALDYEAHELAETPSPVDDDEAIANDITVTRDGGSSARAVQETGTLSVLAPPDGVGRYPSEATISVEYDLDLFDQAAWRLRLGTVDEARIPQLAINLAHESFSTDATLTENARTLEVGDRVTVANPPSQLPPETISQIVQGYSELLGNYEHAITLNCSPESPFVVATYDGTSRYMPVDTVLNEALDTTETGVDITTPTGPLWDTTASGFDVMVGGERMTVSAVGAAAGTVQTLTVTRSVNGVVKAHDSGSDVQLFQPAIYAL